MLVSVVQQIGWKLEVVLVTLKEDRGDDTGGKAGHTAQELCSQTGLNSNFISTTY